MHLMEVILDYPPLLLCILLICLWTAAGVHLFLAGDRRDWPDAALYFAMALVAAAAIAIPAIF